MDQFHDLAYVVEVDKCWQRFCYTNGKLLGWHYDSIHVDVNHSEEIRNKYFEINNGDGIKKDR